MRCGGGRGAPATLAITPHRYRPSCECRLSLTARRHLTRPDGLMTPITTARRREYFYIKPKNKARKWITFTNVSKQNLIKIIHSSQETWQTSKVGNTVQYYRWLINAITKTILVISHCLNVMYIAYHRAEKGLKTLKITESEIMINKKQNRQFRTKKDSISEQISQQGRKNGKGHLRECEIIL